MSASQDKNIPSRKDFALLLIDMQPYFIDTDDKKKLIPNQISVLNACFKRGIPVIVIEYSNTGQTEERLTKVLEKNYEKVFRRIVKTKDDAFIRTDLEKVLGETEAKSLVVMGVNACACVFKTARSATERGFRVVTSDDLIAGYCGGCDEEERRAWYRKNVTYLDHHNQVIGLLKAAA